MINKTLAKIACVSALLHCFILLAQGDWPSALGLFGAFGAWASIGFYDGTTGNEAGSE